MLAGGSSGTAGGEGAAAAAAAAATAADARAGLLSNRRGVCASYGANGRSDCLLSANDMQQLQQDEITPIDNNGESNTKPAIAEEPKQQKQIRKTLLTLAARSSRPQTQKVEDIFRKGIDIAREFDATCYTGQQKVIKLVLADSVGSQCPFPDVRVVSGTNAALNCDDVIIDMPPESPQLARSSWRQKRKPSTSSRAPLISDA